METNKELMRAEFEAWCKKEQGYLYKVEHEDGTPQEDKWSGWQAALSQRSEVAPFGYVAVLTSAGGTIYHRSRIMADRKGAEDCAKQWKDTPYQGTISVLPIYTEPAPSAAAGGQPFPLAWSHFQRIAEAEQFLKAYSDTEMVKLLGDYQVQPIIRKLAAMIGQWQQAAAYAMSADNCAAQPTPAQGDAVPVATKCAVCNGEGWVRDIHDMEQGRIRCTKCATRQSSADAGDAEILVKLTRYDFDTRNDWRDLYKFPKGTYLKYADVAAAIAAQGGKGEMK